MENSPPRIDFLSAVAIGLIVYFAAQVIGGPGESSAFANSIPADMAAGPVAVQSEAEVALAQPEPSPTPDPYAIGLPYSDYVLTQGPHGQSYGHLAIDLAAGKGAPILAPINGEVTDVYIDRYGNTVLVLENEIYQVTMLHGIYTVEAGQQISLGQIVGEESNLGYTTDMQGRSCAGRDCGYHTHLNIYDKLNQSNFNPMELLP